MPCQGETKLGEDHSDTLTTLNNLAVVIEEQKRLEEAELLYCEALEKSPGAQLQGFKWDFGQWIWSHTLLDLCWVIQLLMTGTGAATLLGYLRLIITLIGFHLRISCRMQPTQQSACPAVPR